jgi:protein tyrosine phosphatase
LQNYLVSAFVLVLHRLIKNLYFCTIEYSTMSDINEIIKGLFLGNQWSTSPDCLHNNGIQCILNISCAEADANKGRYTLHDYLLLPIKDNVHETDKMKNEILPQALDFIDKYYRDEGMKVLVHCSAGRSRSATVIIAWLISRQGLSFDEAYQLVNNRRDIQPNHGFMNLLKNM